MIGNMTREAYDALDAVRYSTLKSMRTSPLHYRHRLTTPQKESPTMVRGHSVHLAVLEPDRFHDEHVVYGDGDRRGNAWKSFEAAHAHQIIVKPQEMNEILAIADAVRTHPIAGPLISRCTGYEQTIVWTDTATGLLCKGRADGIGPGLLIDLKQCRTVDARLFSQQAFTLFWHGQAAFYREGMIASLAGEVQSFIVAVENDPNGPHDVGVFEIGHDALFAASEELRELLAKVAKGRESGVWPGRYDAVQELVLPRWAFPEDSIEGLDVNFGGDA